MRLREGSKITTPASLVVTPLGNVQASGEGVRSRGRVETRGGRGPCHVRSRSSGWDRERANSMGSVSLRSAGTTGSGRGAAFVEPVVLSSTTSVR